MYLIAILVPPLAVLLCGKPIQAILCCFLWTLGLLPGMIHACMVVNSYKADKRQERLIAALGR